MDNLIVWVVCAILCFVSLTNQAEIRELKEQVQRVEQEIDEVEEVVCNSFIDFLRQEIDEKFIKEIPKEWK